MSDEKFFDDDVLDHAFGEDWLEDFDERGTDEETAMHYGMNFRKPVEFHPPKPEELSKEEKAFELSLANRFVKTLDKLPQLTPKQRAIAFWIYKGRPTKEIAWRVGSSEAYVSNSRGHEGIKEFVQLLRSGKYIDIIDDLTADQILDNAAAAAAETLAELMTMADSDSVRQSSARDILKMTGHYQQGDDSKVTIVLGDDAIKAYQQVKREIADVVEEAEAEVVE